MTKSANQMRKIIVTGSILMAAAVALGAFGAHFLKDFLEETGRTDTYKTAVLYHMIHALAMVITGSIGIKIRNKFIFWTGYLFAAGTVFFSGSLYALCITGIDWLGAITPVGGILFIFAWLSLATGTIKSTLNNQ